MIDLSPRQRQALTLLADGHTDREMARHLGVSVTTARRHLDDVRTKLGARNRVHAVTLDFRTGMLTREDAP